MLTITTILNNTRRCIILHLEFVWNFFEHIFISYNFKLSVPFKLIKEVRLTSDLVILYIWFPIIYVTFDYILVMEVCLGNKIKTLYYKNLNNLKFIGVTNVSTIFLLIIVNRYSLVGLI